METRGRPKGRKSTPNFVSPAWLARALCVSEQSIAKYIRSGDIKANPTRIHPVSKKPSGFRITREEANKHIAYGGIKRTYATI